MSKFIRPFQYVIWNKEDISDRGEVVERKHISKRLGDSLNIKDKRERMVKDDSKSTEHLRFMDFFGLWTSLCVNYTLINFSQKLKRKKKVICLQT